MKQALSFSVLRIRNFRLLLITRLFTVTALQAQAVIVGWQIYSLTKDPFLLGLTGLAEALPAIACAFFAGHIVDTGAPRKIYTACVTALALNMLGLLTIAGGFVYLEKETLLPYIFSAVFFSGLARSFLMPSVFSLLHKVVSRDDIPSAMAWLSSNTQIALITGPAAAGIVYGGYGAHGAWILPAVLMVSAVIMSLSLRGVNVRNSDTREPIMESIRAGWRFILRTPVLLSVMTLDMFAVLFGGAVAMLPAYADQILHVGPEGLGALRAAPAMGAIVTALFLATQPMKTISAKRLLVAVTGFGLCMIGFGLSEVFWLSMAFLIISGCFDSASMVIRSTLMQLLTPDNMRGRVSSINSMFIISSNEIGAFESGVAARFLGLVPSVVMGGIATLAVVGTIAFSSPKFRKTVVETKLSQ